MKEIKTKLNTSANVIQVLGDQLISNEAVALVELIKNSYDAEATLVHIKFEGPLRQGEGIITIEDNGNGMDLKTIKEAWMTIATNYKKIERKKDRQRKILGEKGIGRFSASKIARKLIMITRAKNSEEEIEVEFDWDVFNDINKMLDDFEIIIKINTPKIFKVHSGTILKMVGLSADWNQKKIEKIANILRRLINPIKKLGDFNIKLDFDEPEFREYSGYVEPPKSIENPIYKIKGAVDENGNIKYEFESLKLKVKEYQMKRPEIKKLEIENYIPIEFEFRAWDLDSLSLKEYSKMIDVRMQTIRDEIRFVSGISLYRDNFRILPYGEDTNDWLRLDYRRINNPSLRLSNNQIVGIVCFREKDTPHLIEQSNREGLIDNQYYNYLRETVLDILDILERKRFPLRRRVKIEDLGKIDNIKINPLMEIIKKKESGYKNQKTLQILEKLDAKLKTKSLKINEIKNKTVPIFNDIKNLITKENKIEIEKVNEKLNTIKTAQLEALDTLIEINEINPILADLTSDVKESIEIEKVHTQEEKRLIKKYHRDIKRKVEEDYEQIKDLMSTYRRLSTLGLLIDRLLHDCNPILGSIHFYAEKIDFLIKEQLIDKKEIKENLTQIYSNLDVLQDYYNSLNPLSGKKTLEIEKLDIKDFIEKNLRFWKKDLKRDNIEFILPEKTYEISVRPSDFLIIFTNLMTNSIYWLKQTDTNLKRIIQINLFKGSDFITMIFSDNGPGIDPEDLDQIFKPYFTRKKNGIGLGLTIIRETLEVYKSDISVIEGPLNGANFEIRFKRGQ